MSWKTAGRRGRRNASGTQAPASGSRLTATITPTRHLAVFTTNLWHLMDFGDNVKKYLPSTILIRFKASKPSSRNKKVKATPDKPVHAYLNRTNKKKLLFFFKSTIPQIIGYENCVTQCSKPISWSFLQWHGCVYAQPA